MIRIVAPSRLHFGLFRVPRTGEDNPEARAFGGMGLMIDQPGVVVTARPADSWQFEGPLASRAQVFAARFMLSVPEERRRSFQILVERCPAEHTGLGVGTQIGLAVAKALAVACGEPDLSSVELATRTGRGERSAIGVHGFDRGGFLVDGGKAPGEPVARLLAQVPLPDEWRVVLFTPHATERWHGADERAAFAAAAAGSPDTLQNLAEAALLGASHGDVDAFGEAVHEYNRRAGEPFATAQGGTYASAEITVLIEEVRALGIRGVGQSSWGPTAFAIVGDSATAAALVQRFRGRVPAHVTRVSFGGHAVRDE